MEVIHYHIAETTTTPTKMTTEIMNTTYPTTTTTTTTMMTPTKIMEALIDNATTSIIEPMDDQWTTNGTNSDHHDQRHRLFGLNCRHRLDGISKPSVGDLGGGHGHNRSGHFGRCGHCEKETR